MKATLIRRLTELSVGEVGEQLELSFTDRGSVQ